MSMRLFRVCLVGALLVGAARAGEDPAAGTCPECKKAAAGTLIGTCSAGPVGRATGDKRADRSKGAAEGAAHGEFLFGVGVDLGGDAILAVEVKQKEGRTSPENFKFSLPVGQFCPVLGPVLGMSAEIVGDHLAEFASEYLVRLACEQVPVEAYPLQYCGAAEECEMPDLCGMAESVLEAAGEMAATPEFTCPYLRQKAEEKKVQQVGLSLGNSVLEKLEDLRKAAKLLRKADALQQEGGDLRKAATLYRKVQKLCPGSHYDHQAAARLKELMTIGLPQAGTVIPDLGIPIRPLKLKDADSEPCEQPSQSTEKQKNHPSDDVNVRMEGLIYQSEDLRQLENDWRGIWFTDQPSNLSSNPHSPATIEKRVGKLLEASHKALVAGQYDRARKLARKAMRLNADMVAAHPLVYKLNLLKQLEAKASQEKNWFTKLSEAMKAVASEACEEAEADPAEDWGCLCPSLPPIDPKVVDALEKILAGTADPLMGKLVVLPESQGQNEEQEDLGPAWENQEPPVDVPSLLVDPENEDLTVEPQEEEQPEEPAPPDMNSVLREVIEAVRGGTCIDVDCSREDGLRAQCQFQVGGVDVKLIWNESGPSFAVIQLLPEGVTDLRAAQRAQNEDIIDWIQSLSGGDEGGVKASPEDPDLPPGLDDDDSDADDTAGS